MSRYVTMRLLQMIPIVMAVSLVVFLILSFSPGDPAEMILGMQAEEAEKDLTREQLGLNDPVLIQYIKYMGRVLTGDFGTSYTTKQPVIKMMAVRLPNTLFLSFGALILTLGVALPLGILLAVKQNSFFDNFMRIASLVLASMPGFWLGLLMIILFSVKLGWLPPNGLESASAAIMPLVCSSVAGWAVRSRYTRALMLDVIRKDYIRTARSKGLKESYIMRKHALKNTLMPFITTIGMTIAGSFGGSVIIETVFGINGMGNLMIGALRQKDIPTIMASVIITAVIIALCNLGTDIAYAFIDPRIKSRYVKPKKRKLKEAL